MQWRAARKDRHTMKNSLALIACAAIFAAATIPRAAAQIPRLGDGRPNLSGIWQTLTTANIDLEDHSAQKDAPAGQSVVEGGLIPYQDSALDKKKENYRNRATADPEGKCDLPGVPRANYLGLPFQIFQGANSDKITILYEYAHTNRFIYMNGTSHPAGPIGWWMGDSRGRWEGDTLVVDNADFNDQTWFDRAGNYHSEDLHVVERYTLIDADHIDYEATIEDPKIFTRPWKLRTVLYRRIEKGLQILDYECYGFDYEKLYP
jgi:hypothetical protein